MAPSAGTKGTSCQACVRAHLPCKRPQEEEEEDEPETPRVEKKKPRMRPVVEITTPGSSRSGEGSNTALLGVLREIAGHLGVISRSVTVMQGKMEEGWRYWEGARRHQEVQTEEKRLEEVGVAMEEAEETEEEGEEEEEA